MSSTVNDHAETVVNKKFAPFIDQIKRDENGTLDQVLTAALALQRNTNISDLPTAADENVRIKDAKFSWVRPSLQGRMNGNSPIAILPVTGVGIQPTTIVRYILQLAFSPDVLQPRHYVAEWGFFCHLHKLCLTMDHGAATLKKNREGRCRCAAASGRRSHSPQPWLPALGLCNDNSAQRGQVSGEAKDCR